MPVETEVFNRGEIFTCIGSSTDSGNHPEHNSQPDDYVQGMRSILADSLSVEALKKFRESREEKLRGELDALEMSIWGDVDET